MREQTTQRAYYFLCTLLVRYILLISEEKKPFYLELGGKNQTYREFEEAALSSLVQLGNKCIFLSKELTLNCETCPSSFTQMVSTCSKSKREQQTHERVRTLLWFSQQEREEHLRSCTFLLSSNIKCFFHCYKCMLLIANISKSNYKGKAVGCSELLGHLYNC